jgi:ketosteroid isomerase-like protein
MTLRESVKDLYGMLWQGRAAEAWDKYYADDLVRRNGFEPTRVGKTQNQAHEQDFLNCVTDWKAFELQAMAVDEDRSVTMVVLFMEFTHKQWGDIRQGVVTVQRWRDGKIHDESSYVMRMEEASDRPMPRVGSSTAIV